MRRIEQFIIIFIIILLPGFIMAQSKGSCQVKDQIIADYKNFYSPNNLWKLSLGIGYAGFHANTTFDQEIQDFYADYVKRSMTDDMAKIFKPFGNGRITVPIYLTAALIGELSNQSKIGAAIGTWGQRCCRALLVGAPPVLALQMVLGASRPEEGNGSRWHSFNDDNGVSGHSFMGAVPFLTAAKMTNYQFLRYPLYLASTFTGISRINDNKHYFSQAILGWWIAYLSVDSIKSQKFVFVPSAKGIGVGYFF